MRACIAICKADRALELRIGKLRLPKGVQLTKQRELFECAGDLVELRLEGDGLPPEFEVNQGQVLSIGYLTVLEGHPFVHISVEEP